MTTSPASPERIDAPPRLYLFTPAVTEPAVFLATLEAALDAGDVAAVLLRLADADERTLINRAKAIALPVQRRDIALLLDGQPSLVARSGADGAHLRGVDTVLAAIEKLKPDHIIGAGGLRSRDDAMLAAEAGADYVMFGEPPQPAAGHGAADETVLERIKWWAELFEVPCIGYAASLDEIRPLAEAGVDFVALGEWIWTQHGGAKAALASAAQQLGAPAAS